MLLRRHVSRRTHGGPGLSEGAAGWIEGDPEIADLYFAAVPDHDISRFQIAVNDPPGVDLFEAAGEFERNQDSDSGVQPVGRLQHAGQIGDDVAGHVGGHQHVVILGLADEPPGEGVHDGDVLPHLWVEE